VLLLVVAICGCLCLSLVNALACGVLSCCRCLCFLSLSLAVSTFGQRTVRMYNNTHCTYCVNLQHEGSISELHCAKSFFLARARTVQFFLQTIILFFANNNRTQKEREKINGLALSFHCCCNYTYTSGAGVGELLISTMVMLKNEDDAEL
jgi:hypothetical protein